MDNPFNELFEKGQIIKYLDLNLIVIFMSFGYTKQTPFMRCEYLNTRNEIQEKTFYQDHIPALKIFNKGET